MIDWLLAYAAAHPHLLGLIVFVSAFAEAIVVVGVVFPGSGLIVAIAAAAGAAHAPVLPLVLWAVAGASLADGLGYWIGHRYGPHLRGRWPFRSRAYLLDTGQDFFARYGGKAVFVARFVPGPRSVVPVVAGMVGMPVARFYAANVASAVVWSALHVLPAAGLGVAFGQLRQISGRLVLLLVAALLLGWLTLRLLRAAILRLLPRILALWTELDRRLRQRPEPLLRRIGELLDPARPTALAVLFWLAVGLAGTYGLLGVAEDVITGDSLVIADRALSNLVQGLRSEPADGVMVAVTMLGDGVVTVPVALAALLVLLLEGERRSALALITLEGATALLVPALKWLVGRPRPLELYTGIDAFAFPSGHATFATVTWGCLAVVLARGLAWRRRMPIYGAAALLAVAIGLSRIYLGAHWPSDVLAGWLLGLVVTAAFALVVERERPAAAARPGVRAVPLLVLALAGGWHLARDRTVAMARYTGEHPPLAVPLADWWAGAYGSLPQRRIDLAGEDEEPFVLQWAGEPGPLVARVDRLGFAPSNPAGPADLLAFLRPDAPVSALPPLPLLHDGRAPVVVLTRALDDGRRLVLRMWPAGRVLAAGERTDPLLVASLALERAYHPWRLASLLRDEPAPAEWIARLGRELEHSPPAGHDCRTRRRASALPPLLTCAPASAVAARAGREIAGVGRPLAGPPG